jgi:hypothetical protein
MASYLKASVVPQIWGVNNQNLHIATYFLQHLLILNDSAYVEIRSNIDWYGLSYLEYSPSTPTIRLTKAPT